jgi:diaminopropionate ammonia-lyase
VALTFLCNPMRDRAWVPDVPPGGAVRSFHRGLPGYQPTPLVSLPEVAARLGLRQLHVKDETGRLGTGSFKILGCAWAAAATLQAIQGWGGPPDPGQLPALGAAAAREGRYFLTASAGNHGQALARLAAWCGLPCRVLLPAATPAEASAVVAAEGAQVELIEGSYDTAVLTARARGEENPRAILVSDTSWPGNEQVPLLVVDGYDTLFSEIAEAGLQPDVVVVQMGVGALAAAAVRHLRSPGKGTGPLIVGVEPSAAACIGASIAAGTAIALPQLPGTVMTGLDCGTPSPVAWPYLARGIDGLVTVKDDDAIAAQSLLGDVGLRTGPTGAAGLAGLWRACRDEQLRERLGLGSSASVLALITEGAGPGSLTHQARQPGMTSASES